MIFAPLWFKCFALIGYWMTEIEQEPVVETPDAPAGVRRQRGLLGRLGCVALFVVWLFFMLLPSLLIILAIQGEIGLWHGGRIPDSEAHPLLLIKLLNDPENLDHQGFSVTTSSVSRAAETEICLQTHVRYFLWEGDGPPASYCDCYTRASADAEAGWDYAGSTQGACGG